jgi:NADPH-dependent curcumin reductase CurA
MTSVVVFGYLTRHPEGIARLGKWLNTGELRSHERIENGDVGAFAETLLKPFEGQNTGEIILAPSDPSSR